MVYLFATTLSYGEGNGTPLQCSSLDNPGAGEPGGLTSMGSRRVGLNSNSNMSMEFDNYFQKIVSILFNGSTSASDRALIQVDF